MIGYAPSRPVMGVGRNVVHETPRSLRAMLASSKDTAGLMVDLAYSAVYFGDPELAGEVDILWEELAELSHQMRVVAILAARTRREAEGMALVLQVIGAMEDLGRDAVDIARIASEGVGIPAGLVTALSEGESVLSRVVIGPGSPLVGPPLSSLQLPLETGTRVIAVRRGGGWDVDIGNGTVLEPNDVVVLVGPQIGLARVRRLAGTPDTAPSARSDDTPTTDTVDGAAADDSATDLGAAVEVLGEMKTLSEVAVGLAYAVLLAGDPALADEVGSLAGHLDALKVELHAWVLQAANTMADTSGLASLLRLSQAAEDLGDRAAGMVQHVTRQQQIHPVVAVALGESDEAAEGMTIANGSQADGAPIRQVTAGTGFDVLALRRDGRYQHRPANALILKAGDELIATGPQAGRSLLSARCT